MTSSASDPVSRALLPALVHEVNNTTQLLVGMKALLDLPGGEALFEGRAGDLAESSDRMADLGFALAVLATANGADVLLARRHERGLGILWDLAVRSLERSGEARVAVVGEPPRIVPSALDGWQVPWGAAALLVHASEAAGVDAWRWRWEDGGRRLVGSGSARADLDEHQLGRIADRLPGGRLEVTQSAITLELAPQWIAG